MGDGTWAQVFSATLTGGGDASDATLQQIRDEIGDTGGTKSTDPNATATLIQIAKGLLQQNVTQRAAGLGQTTMVGSEPVVIASNQTAIPITDNSGSLTVDGTVGVNSLPAAAPTTDGIGISWRIEEAYSGLTAATLAVASSTEGAGWADISSGTTENIAQAVSSKKIAVLGAVILAKTAVATTFQFFEGSSSGAATAALGPQFQIGDTGGVGRGFVLPLASVPWIKMATAGRYLTGTAGAGANVIVVALTAAY
jgi:hypothetical protein